MAVVDRLYDISPQARTDLYRWIETLLAPKLGSGGDAVRFNSLNTALPSRYLDITANDIGADGLGYNIDNQSTGGARLGSKHALFLQGRNGNTFLNLGNGGDEIVAGTAHFEFDVPLISATGTAFALVGIGGATAAARWVGATASGRPATGTYAIGDWVTTRDGHIWICTTAGSPGTWFDVGSAWGAAGSARFAGSGTPVGSVTPEGIGDLYVDKTTPGLWQATGLTNADWDELGSGAGAITEITSTGLTVDVTSGTGPVTNLEVVNALTDDEKAALDAANAPDAGNPFATILDVTGGASVSTVTDGITTVFPAVTLSFTSGATVTDAGAGVAEVAVSAVAASDTGVLNSGTWLDIETTSTDGDGYGFQLKDTGAGGALLWSGSAAFAQVDSSTFLVKSNVGFEMYPVAGGALTLYDFSSRPIMTVAEDSHFLVSTFGDDGSGHGIYLYAEGGAIQIEGSGYDVGLQTTEATYVYGGTGLYLNYGSSGVLSFFGATGTAQAATPVTLGDVIAVLQGYGLAA